MNILLNQKHQFNYKGITCKLIAFAVFFIANCGLLFAQSKPDSALTIDRNGNIQLGGSLHMDGNPIYLRKDISNPNEFIKWNPTEDKIDIGSYCGVRIGNTSPAFSPVLNIGRYKLVNGAYLPGIAVDVMGVPRTGNSHPTTALTMYVTGDINTRDKSIQFRQSDASQGIGFTMNAIYTAGSIDNQDLNMEVTQKGRLIFKTDNTPRMFINKIGNVRIGDGITADPINKLELAGDLHMDGNAIFLRQGVTNKNEYIKWTGYTATGTTDDRIKISGWHGVDLAATQTNTVALSVSQNGFVGIGTMDPEMPLHVKKEKGNSPYEYSHGVNNGNALDLGWGKGTEQTFAERRRFNRCSILADGDIVTKNVLVTTQTGVYSDIRLKKDIVPSSSKQDLDKLKEIQIVDYKMIDTIADNKQYKKVIAQQIQKIYPRAVDVSFRTLPDVFQAAQLVIKQTDSLYKITLAKSQNLKVGDKLELKCEPANDVTVEVTQVVGAKSFIVKSAVVLNEQKSVFVYGRPADDVLAVDYDALSMLNISATQELAKTIDEQQKQIQLLKKANTDMALENEKLKNEQAATKTIMNNILVRLSQVEENKSKPLQQIVASVQK